MQQQNTNTNNDNNNDHHTHNTTNNDNVVDNTTDDLGWRYLSRGASAEAPLLSVGDTQEGGGSLPAGSAQSCL